MGADGVDIILEQSREVGNVVLKQAPPEIMSVSLVVEISVRAAE